MHVGAAGKRCQFFLNYPSRDTGALVIWVGVLCVGLALPVLSCAEPWGLVSNLRSFELTPCSLFSFSLCRLPFALPPPTPVPYPLPPKALTLHPPKSLTFDYH